VNTPTATARLEQSRTLLRQALHGKPSRADAPPKPVPAWQAHLQSIPVLAVLAEAVSSWWMQHPLRVASTLVAETTRAVVQPLAQRNPMGLAVAALLVGGLLAWSRPWRWVLKPALFAGLWSQLLSKGIAHLPLESWLAALGSVVWQKKPAQPTDTAPEAASVR
jgi:hypothetical protein